MGCVDSGMVGQFAAARVQLRDRPDGRQPSAAVDLKHPEDPDSLYE